MTRLLPLGLLLGFTLACGSGETFQIGKAAVDCDLTVDTLDGTTWVMLQAMPDKTEVPNPMARMHFFTEDGMTKVKYTALSLGDVYTYECKKRGKGGKEELFCAEHPKIESWCQSLMVHESDSCTAAKLREFGATDVSDEELAKGIASAKVNFDKYTGTDKEAHFRLNNNNLGNKLRGMMFVKVDKRRCQLSIDDMYMTIYNGKKLEDFNPVGKNPFVKSDETFLFEHCADGRHLGDLESAELPKDPSTVPPRNHSSGKPIYYHYFGDKASKAEEGCSYSYDSFAQWRPVSSGVAVAPGKKGALSWDASHTFPADKLIEVMPGRTGAVFTMVRYKNCGGIKEKIDVVCNAVPLK